MKPTQAIQDKAIELSALYAAVANGRELQWDQRKSYDEDRDWSDPGNASPGLRSDLSRWRVKPEPRRMWTCNSTITRDGSVADTWRSKSMKVTEWVEVLS